MKYSNLKIRTRLNMGLGVLLVVIGGMTVSGIMKLQDIVKSTQTLTQHAVKKEQVAAEWYAHTYANSVRGYASVKIQNPEDLKKLKAEMADTSKAIDKNQEMMLKLSTTDVEKAAMAKVLELRKAYTNARKNAMEVAATGTPEAAYEAVENKMMPALRDYVASIVAVQALANKDIETQVQDINAAYEHSRNMLIMLGSFGILIGALLAWRLTTSITGAINDAVQVARTVAAGDLTHEVEIKTQDETGVLMHSLKDMNSSLLKTVTAVRDGTDSINSAAHQISIGNQDLASRTAAQAGALEETSAAIETLTGAVRKNADSAEEANRLAVEAAHVAHQGGDVVAEVVDVMKAIELSSKKIVDIISVIDGIAFQTNILALNAAVEAARAGEQGRGFAVVAAEVRSLAQRSATAAKEIAGLINESVTKVSSGTQLVATAGDTMNKVVTSIDQVTTIMNEIAQSTREQSTGIEQVNSAISDMDGMTQQNSALVEEAAAAAEEMQAQANMLRELVSDFKV